MRFKSLSELKRPKPYEIFLANLPQNIVMSQYAKTKTFKINELILTIHGDSFEWYGYTLGTKDSPELIIDIGLPKNELNDPVHKKYRGKILICWAVEGDWILDCIGILKHLFQKSENHFILANYENGTVRKPV